MFKITLKIEGMACGMCEAHICGTIRKAVPDAKKVTASHKRGEASFLSDAPADEAALKNAVAATGYACAPSFEAAMRKYGVDYEMIVGEGMFHCYPVFPVCREAKAGWEQMIRMMKKEA